MAAVNAAAAIGWKGGIVPRAPASCPVPEISLTGDQMLTVLEAVAQEGPVSAADIARHCGMNRTVAYRLLTTLAQRGYVRRGEKGYAVGPAALRLARAADSALRQLARPVMDRLAQSTGETVVLHALDGLDAVVVDQALGRRHVVRVEHVPGSRHSLALGASGLALLAHQDEALRARLPGSDALAARLAAVRANGYATSHDELQLGVHGIAVPILGADGRCEASLAVLLPAARAGLLESLAPDLLAAARAIARDL